MAVVTRSTDGDKDSYGGFLLRIQFTFYQPIINGERFIKTYKGKLIEMDGD
jgi:hypothetical protein